MRKTVIYSIIFLGFLGLFSNGHAETLVVENESGGFEPGVAVEHRIEGDALVLVLREGADAQAVASVLRERLAHVQITVEAKVLTLRGVEPNTLLGQISRVDVTGDGGDENPLGALSALGGEMKMADQDEEGSSIRASKPMAVAPKVAPHDKNQRLVGQITRVTLGEFPEVTLEFRVRWPIQAGPLKGKWRKGALVKAAVLTSLELESKAMQGNLLAYYLKPGDRIWAHLRVDEKGTVTMDWLERRTGKRK
jgi:hypothetical protein